MAKEKKRHWKTNLQKPLIEGLIPNHPEISTKTLTAIMLAISKKTLSDDVNVDDNISARVGSPKA